MHLTSINLGKAERHPDGQDGTLTGIYKCPVAHPVTVTWEGLEGDAVCDGRYHGGVDQALYLYGEPEYAHWEKLLGRALTPGTFGENLTLSGFESPEMAVGDRFHIGAVTLEATSPRTPCGTLSRRMQDSKFLKQFREVEKFGIYCRVLRTGVVQTGEEVLYEPFQGDRVTMIELFRELFQPTKDPEVLRRHLAAPLAIRVRELKEEQLAKLTA